MTRKRPTRKTAEPAGTRVLLVDDHPFLRMGLAEALAGEPGLQICGAVATAAEALAAVEQLHPDVVVTDLNLPGRSGLELIKDLANLRPGLPVIVLSMHDEEIYAERCLRAGARGYVMKSEDPGNVATAIRKVLTGGLHVGAKASALILQSFAGIRRGRDATPLGQLTAREFELFQCFGRGASTKEIAAELQISAKTIETHRMHIKAKLGLATAAELTAYAARWVAAAG